MRYKVVESDEGFTKVMKSCVYLVRLSNLEFYKIGMTADLDSRLKAIRFNAIAWADGSGMTLAEYRKLHDAEINLVSSVLVPDAKTLEFKLHQRFSSYRLDKTEWFSFPPSMISQVVASMACEAAGGEHYIDARQFYSFAERLQSRFPYQKIYTQLNTACEHPIAKRLAECGLHLTDQDFLDLLELLELTVHQTQILSSQIQEKLVCSIIGSICEDPLAIERLPQVVLSARMH